MNFVLVFAKTLIAYCLSGCKFTTFLIPCKHFWKNFKLFFWLTFRNTCYLFGLAKIQALYLTRKPFNVLFSLGCFGILKNVTLIVLSGRKYRLSIHTYTSLFHSFLFFFLRFFLSIYQLLENQQLTYILARFFTNKKHPEGCFF